MFNLQTLLVLAFMTAFHALPDCAVGVKCPEGGIWSEWTSPRNCSSSCGTCAKQFFTRTCLSESVGCKCIGDTSRYVLCNTQTCQFPAQRTCCIPFVPMLINGSMQCGPLPKFTEQYQPCCPIGGLWTEWSEYGKSDNGTMWLRTRNCLSEGAGCPCNGEAVISSVECPCREFANVRKNLAFDWGFFENDFVIDHGRCQIRATMVTKISSVSQPCGAIGAYSSATAFRYTSLTSTRVEFVPYDCSSGANIVELHCDLKTLYWKLLFDNDDVIGWNQINRVSGAVNW